MAGDLHRVAGGSSARVGTVPRAARALAVAGDTLVVATATELLASSDRGMSFRAMLALDRPTHASGDRSRSGLGGVGGRRRACIGPAGVAPARSWRGRSRDLQACDGRLVALADEGLFASTDDGDLERLSGPLPARRIACPLVSPGPWVVAGDGLMVSADQGRTFRPRADTPAGIISAAAFGARPDLAVRGGGPEQPSCS